MEEAEALSDRIGVMKDGKLLFVGTKEELFEVIRNIKAVGTGNASKILAVNLMTGEILHSQSYDSTHGGKSFDFYVADFIYIASAFFVIWCSGF